MKRIDLLLIPLVLLFITLPYAGWAGRRDVILATTTSVSDSGILDLLIGAFEEETGFRVKILAVGTGEALEMGRRGEADVVITHARTLEEQFVSEGFGINRRLVMSNDFVILGPREDPAHIREASLPDAFRRIAREKALFLSRGDNSGTHIREKALWKEAGVIPSHPWYLESGQGMGETLVIADEKRAYTLSDRGTYLSEKKVLQLAILIEGDPSLNNPYSIIEVNPALFPKVNGPGAHALSNFLISERAQTLIKRFGIDTYGEPLFFPAAHE